MEKKSKATKRGRVKTKHMRIRGYRKTPFFFAQLHRDALWKMIDCSLSERQICIFLYLLMNIDKKSGRTQSDYDRSNRQGVVIVISARCCGALVKLADIGLYDELEWETRIAGKIPSVLDIRRDNARHAKAGAEIKNRRKKLDDAGFEPIENETHRERAVSTEIYDSLSPEVQSYLSDNDIAHEYGLTLD